ncbi:MAG: hypothetical protein MUC83_15715 [Pirellula sp.]|nr:hypothetical protein [Pirellula sp.]
MRINQKSVPFVPPICRAASAILCKLGMADGMWCDLVWNFKKYFGRNCGAGSPDNMREDAVSHSLSFQPGQTVAKESVFANARS